MKMHSYLLKPCPMCGSSDIIMEDFEPTDNYTITVKCNNCGLNKSMIYNKPEESSFDSLVNYWNHRYNEEEN